MADASTNWLGWGSYDAWWAEHQKSYQNNQLTEVGEAQIAELESNNWLGHGSQDAFYQASLATIPEADRAQFEQQGAQQEPGTGACSGGTCTGGCPTGDCDGHNNPVPPEEAAKPEVYKSTVDTGMEVGSDTKMYNANDLPKKGGTADQLRIGERTRTGAPREIKSKQQLNTLELGTGNNNTGVGA